MNLSISCRVASKADLPEILRLYSQPDMDDGRVLPLPQAEVLFERMAHYPNYKLFVAVHEDRIVGSFALLIMDNLGHMGAPSAVIEDIVTDPAYQSRGIGKSMMAFALSVAGKEGCYKAMLSSNLKRQRAQMFYESLGFERHGYSFRISARQSPPPGTKDPRG